MGTLRLKPGTKVRPIVTEPLPTQATVDRLVAETIAAHRADLHAPQLGIGRVSSHVRKGQPPRRKRP